MSNIPWAAEIKKWKHSKSSKNDFEDIENLTVGELITKLEDHLKMEAQSNPKETSMPKARMMMSDEFYDTNSDDDD